MINCACPCIGITEGEGTRSTFPYSALAQDNLVSSAMGGQEQTATGWESIVALGYWYVTASHIDLPEQALI